MNVQQRIQVITGLTCWQLLWHSVVIAALLLGWRQGVMMPVSVGLCLMYAVAFSAMLMCQRTQSLRLRGWGDVLEELTTTWYVGMALIVLWMLSRIIDNHIVLVVAGLAMVAGPALFSLLRKDKSSRHLTAKHPVRR